MNIEKVKGLYLMHGKLGSYQMAEAFLREYAGDRYEVSSAVLESK